MWARLEKGINRAVFPVNFSTILAEGDTDNLAIAWAQRRLNLRIIYQQIGGERIPPAYDWVAAAWRHEELPCGYSQQSWQGVQLATYYGWFDTFEPDIPTRVESYLHYAENGVYKGLVLAIDAEGREFCGLRLSSTNGMILVGAVQHIDKSVLHSGRLSISEFNDVLYEIEF